ncbi:sugar transferase [uncultured Algibacter sp.]|uniref:sugar transferase n=1 Tax=uncultured Algibacter sp. TaxID=298659 RepID=UPI00261BEFB2|nr:sugar transferase [uncultured Algibacter sp.]
MKKKDAIIKRIFDVTLSLITLLELGLFILLLIIIARMDTGQSGIFKQKRVGQHGFLFNIYKLRTIKEDMNGIQIITSVGKFLRKSKLDELPQLFNVLIGDMSFVGPRPDIEGFADKLIGDDRIILSIKPGITGVATIYFRDEELLLKNIENPENYNLNVIWPKKIALNKDYINEYSFVKDIKLILKTIFRI